MLKKKIGFLFMMLLALSLFSGITGCSFRVQTSFGSEGGVQVGKTFYSDGVCLPVLYSYQQIYEKNYGFGQDISLWQQELTGDLTCWEYVRDRIALEEFCCAAALSQMAQERGIAIPPEDSEKLEFAAEQYFQSVRETDWAEDCVTPEDIRQLFSIYRLAQLCIGDLTRSVSSNISDDEIRVIEICRMTADSREEAQQLWERLNQGDTIESVSAAPELTDCEELTLRRTEAEEELENAAFRLKTGEYSEPVLLSYGWSVLYCRNDYNIELSEQNRKTVLEDRRTQAWLPEYRQWMENAGVYLNRQYWDDRLPIEQIGEQQDLFTVFRDTFPEADAQ